MRKIFGFVLLLAVSTVGAYGQAGLGSLAGVISDPTQAVIPHATVTITGINGINRTVETNSGGQYVFSSLPVGAFYELIVTAPGFTTAKFTNLSTSVGTTITLNATLQPGSAETTVEVEGRNVEQVQTDTSSISQLVDSTIWKTSPLETRSQNDFVKLIAGASPSDGATVDRGAAVNGARSGAGNYLVDGFDNNDQGQGGAGVTYGSGGAVTTISPDAIQEYRVITSTPPAEYGRAGGFATDTVLKSGSNNWHGSAFGYNRIQTLAANHYFSNQSGLRDHLVRNQFGGSLGGPIKKDKTFFFATAEFHRLRTGSPLTYTGTTQQFIDFVDSGQYRTFMESDPAGVCQRKTGSACPGAFTHSGALGPIFKQLYAKFPGSFPLATIPDSYKNAAGGDYSSGLVTFPVPVYGQGNVIQTIQTNQNRGSFKLDHKLTEKDQLSFSYIVDQFTTSQNNGGGDSAVGPPEDVVGGSQIFGATWTRTFTPTLLNVFKASYLRHVANFAAPGTQGISSITTADALTTGFGASAGIPQSFTDNQFSYEDALTKTVGKQTLKFGFRFARTRNGSSFYNDFYGSINPWSVDGLLTDGLADEDQDQFFSGANGDGSLYGASAAYDPTNKRAPDPYRGYRANEFSAYAQSDWKISPRLTLNYGLRWEYFGPPHNFKAGVDSNVYFGTFGTPTPTGNPFLPSDSLFGSLQGSQFIQKAHNISNKDTNWVAPRLGFSLETLSNGNFVVRGGFGLGYDRLYNNVYENIRFNAPFFVDNAFGTGNGTAPIDPNLRTTLYQVPFTANA